ncbi:hypothetical protein C8F04DRAFT_1192295 [Mycena alexandri]|uniref:Uncharacterized protein n=1 Tax=Mycena alexandri TaxID=1745969 RepID=A0AAD6SFQ1_9AGAR|nr:hypothetical protein C8F04DRAFT_1192295 [Mycena alexandri]
MHVGAAVAGWAHGLQRRSEAGRSGEQKGLARGGARTGKRRGVGIIFQCGSRKKRRGRERGVCLKAGTPACASRDIDRKPKRGVGEWTWVQQVALCVYELRLGRELERVLGDGRYGNSMPKTKECKGTRSPNEMEHSPGLKTIHKALFTVAGSRLCSKLSASIEQRRTSSSASGLADGDRTLGVLARCRLEPIHRADWPVELLDDSNLIRGAFLKILKPGVKNPNPGQGFRVFGLKNPIFGQGNREFSVSKIQSSGQSFGGASRGLLPPMPCQEAAQPIPAVLGGKEGAWSGLSTGEKSSGRKERIASRRMVNYCQLVSAACRLSADESEEAHRDPSLLSQDTGTLDHNADPYFPLRSQSHPRAIPTLIPRGARFSLLRSTSPGRRRRPLPHLPPSFALARFAVKIITSMLLHEPDSDLYADTSISPALRDVPGRKTSRVRPLPLRRWRVPSNLKECVVVPALMTLYPDLLTSNNVQIPTLSQWNFVMKISELA